MSDKLKALFVCGGTGGHIFPAVAVADEFLKINKACEVVFAGRDKPSMEEKLLAKIVNENGENKYRYKTIKAFPLKRGGILENLTLPFRLLSSVFGAVKLLKREKPNFVFGTGGYVALPVMLAAIICRIPFFILEPNAVMGVANKLCAKFAKKVYVSSATLGNPIRTLPSEFSVPPKFADSEKFKVLITGGSQGALGINKKIEESISRILESKNLSVVWQAGAKHAEQLNNKYANKNNLTITAFLDNIYSYMFHCDLIISRSGASTLAEILAFGKPSILLPYPFATANHQEHNARAVEKKGAALVELDSDKNDLWNKVEELMNDRKNLKEMSQRAMELGELNRRAAADIAKDIFTRACV